MRAFLALTPSDEQREALSALQDHLRCGRHVDEDDLHLTLAFLGDVSLSQLDELDLTLGSIRPGPVPLEIGGLGVFGGDAPRQVHAAVDAEPRIVHLQAKVSTAARRCGIALPHRRFVPHVTLARFARWTSAEDHARLGRFLAARSDMRLPPALRTELCLYRSTLSEDGPRYDLLESYPLC